MVHVKRAMDLGVDSKSSLILGNLKAKMRMDMAPGFSYDRCQVYMLMTSLKRPIMAAEKRPEVARRIPHLDGLNLASFPHLQSTLFSSPEVCNCLLEY